MICPSCTEPNSQGRVYCGGCGRAVAARCQRCAFINELDCAFCGGCACELTAISCDAAPVGSAEVGMLALEQVNELLRAPHKTERPQPPRALGSQEEVDRLFGDVR